MSAWSRCRVVSFEPLGTLLDVRAGIDAGLADRAGIVHPGQREKILDEFADAEWELLDEVGEALPWREIVARALVRAASRAGSLLAPAAAQEIAAGLSAWPLFADAVPALRRIADRYKIAFVTHADRDDAAALAARLPVKIVHTVSAGDLEAYKPEPDLLLALLHELELDEDELLHVGSSPDYDLYTAEDIGVPSAFVDRDDAGLPEDLEVALHVKDLATLASALCDRRAGRGAPGGHRGE